MDHSKSGSNGAASQLSSKEAQALGRTKLSVFGCGITTLSTSHDLQTECVLDDDERVERYQEGYQEYSQPDGAVIDETDEAFQ